MEKFRGAGLNATAGPADNTGTRFYNEDHLYESVWALHNGNGSVVGAQQFFTLRDCRFEGSWRGDGRFHGTQGLSMSWVRHGLIERTRINDNAAKGMWFAGNNLRFSDCEWMGNKGEVFWQDHFAEHVRFERCKINNNGERGATFEIARGPVSLLDCEISNNASNGLWFATSSGVVIDRCRIINNAQQAPGPLPAENLRGNNYWWHGRAAGQIVVSTNPREAHLGLVMNRANLPIAYPYALNYTIRNSVIAGRTQGTSLISQYWHTEPRSQMPAYVDWYKTQLTASGNTYWHATNPTPFHLDAELDPAKQNNADLAGWQKASGQDHDSIWKEPAPGR